jgi:excisionase family DNA binding protein
VSKDGTAAGASNGRKWITIADAAERLSVSPATIRRFIAHGQLPGYRIGGHRGRLLRVEIADVDALLVRIPTARAT